MPLTVLQVSYALAPVGRDAAGGAEQVLTAVDAALVAAGHRSIVIAPAQSRCRGTLVPLPPVPGTIDPAAQDRAACACRAAIARVLADRRVDVVHLHGVDCARYLPPPSAPTLISLHLPIGWYPDALFTRARGAVFACVSDAQRRTLRLPPARTVTVPNGVDVEGLPRRDLRPRRFALMLGRLCPEKGFHLAIEAAARAAMPLVIGGRVFPYAAHRRYFEGEIAPRIDGRTVRWVGPVGLAKKRRLLSQARCVLVPSLAPETSSLVVMEALACGAPAIVSPAGALPSLVEHGRTGFVIRSIDEMAAAITAAEGLDRARCRAQARARFDVRQMTGRYVALYHRMARDGRARRAYPRGNPGVARMFAACQR